MNDVSILYSYGIIFSLLLPLFLFYSVDFSLLLEKKILLFPSAYKTILIYLYGIPGAWTLLFCYAIATITMIYLYLKRISFSRQIIYFPLIIPPAISYFSYFFSPFFIMQGLLGSLTGTLLTQKISFPIHIISLAICLLIYFFFTGKKGIQYIIFSIQKIIITMNLNSIFKTLSINFFSWIKFFFKIKSIKIDESYEIEKLLYKKMLYDFKKGFYSVRKNEYSDFTEKIDKKETMQFFRATKKFNNTPKKFNHINNEIDIANCKDNLAYFSLLYDSLVSINGPLVTTTIITPQKHITIQKIQEIIPNFTRLMGKPDLRFIYPVKNHPHAIAFEYSHGQEQTLFFNDWINFEELTNKKELEIPIGLDSYGNIFYLNFSEAPHVLLCGTTGSGKSSVIQTIICGLLIKNTSKKLQIGLIDPKKSEFFYFNALPHLLLPIAYDIDSAENLINATIQIMNERYSLFNKKMVKNISEYKEKFENIPYIIIIIDEYADLIMQSKTIEKKIIRLLQMSRAAGIHIILSTQRPSADIINSSVKSNLPVKIACRVTSSINSRIIINSDGAEKLIGKGDMLVAIEGELKRVHGFFSTQELIKEIIDFYIPKNN